MPANSPFVRIVKKDPSDLEPLYRLLDLAIQNPGEGEGSLQLKQEVDKLIGKLLKLWRSYGNSDALIKSKLIKLSSIFQALGEIQDDD